VLGLVLGGGVANLLERAAHSFVTDFIAFSFWPSFNFADIAITLGVALLLYWHASIFLPRPTHD
jgi:signal peptidase II